MNTQKVIRITIGTLSMICSHLEKSRGKEVSSKILFATPNNSLTRSNRSHTLLHSSVPPPQLHILYMYVRIHNILLFKLVLYDFEMSIYSQKISDLNSHIEHEIIFLDSSNLFISLSPFLLSLPSPPLASPPLPSPPLLSSPLLSSPLVTSDTSIG